MEQKNRIGLVAGRGNLPFEALREIKERGKETVVVGLTGEVDPTLKSSADYYTELPPGQLGKIIDYLKGYELAELVFAGKVGKEALFRGGFDPFCQQMLAGLPQKNDDAILLAIVEAFEQNGLHVAKQTEYLQRLLAPDGLLVGETITTSEAIDLKLGFRMAKASGELDIGQSVIVKSGMVLAVEAIEGTDQAIRRGGTLGGPGAIVVKVSKPKQDERFDVPTVGVSTLQSMIAVGASLLGIEAKKTLMLEFEQMKSLAAEHHIKIVSL